MFAWNSHFSSIFGSVNTTNNRILLAKATPNKNELSWVSGSEESKKVLFLFCPSLWQDLEDTHIGDDYQANIKWFVRVIY